MLTKEFITKAVPTVSTSVSPYFITFPENKQDEILS